jgi:hypothetical protein
MQGRAGGQRTDIRTDSKRTPSPNSPHPTREQASAAGSASSLVLEALLQTPLYRPSRGCDERGTRPKKAVHRPTQAKARRSHHMLAGTPSQSRCGAVQPLRGAVLTPPGRALHPAPWIHRSRCRARHLRRLVHRRRRCAIAAVDRHDGGSEVRGVSPGV